VSFFDKPENAAPGKVTGGSQPNTNFSEPALTVRRFRPMLSGDVLQRRGPGINHFLSGLAPANKRESIFFLSTIFQRLIRLPG
jgi:hypothetical protein